MNKCIAALLFFLFFSTEIFSQEISGIILDKQSGEPLIGATVAVKGTGSGTATDIDGKFKLKVSEKPPLTLSFSYIGYTAQEMNIKTEEDLKRSFNIRLATEERVLKDVEVVDFRITQKQKESPLTVESMGLQAIKQTASSTFYEGLSTLKGVDMTAASLGFVIINTRGFNSTSPVRSLQLLDGADNQAPGLNFSVGNFAGATEIDIQKVDLIVGASSPLFGPNAFNGVINMQTKNPFYYNGLTVFVKGGERGLFEGALRFAKSFKNKNGQDKFAFKVNFSYLKANDWVADNLTPATNSWRPAGNPGGFDAVNRYGDELLSSDRNNYDNPQGNLLYPGLKQFFRTGYEEYDVVNYNFRNIKINGAAHYKVTDKIELKASYNYGAGTTVYQGDNRYSLKGFNFQQAKIEVSQPDKFFIRAYTTMENSGNSYDAVFTALKLQEYAKEDDKWQQNYTTFWQNGVSGFTAPSVRVKALPGYPNVSPAIWYANYDSLNGIAVSVLNTYQDSLTLWHNMARVFADTFIQFGGKHRLIPGTAAYDYVLNDIISRTVFEEKGTLFYDRSKLFHTQGEYRFDPKLKNSETPLFNLTVGASFRMYFPESRGTIFSDTVTNYKIQSTIDASIRNVTPTEYRDNQLENDTSIKVLEVTRRKIRNWEVGMYLSLSRKFDFGPEKKHAFIITATCRVDKNQNFPFIATPAASLIYSYNNNHTIRVSFSSAIRNPTLQDQYLYYNVGRALLVGNLDGFDSLATIPSLRNFLSSSTFDRSLLQFVDVPKVRPEKVQSVEIGYKGIIAKKLFVDGSAYVNFYRYFLGYQIGATLTEIGGFLLPKQVYRVAANSPDRVMTYGVSAGFNYYFVRNYSLNGNYSWNKINLLGSTDSIIPAYNTPEHKFNVGVSGSDIKIKNAKGLGFNITYKWIQGFTFEGSPQFTGSIPTYSLLDAQVNWNVKKIYTTFKLGGSNLISKHNYQAYGGPGIGRMIYFSALIELDQETLRNWYEKVKTKW